MKKAHYTTLFGEDRSIAHMAARARVDTLFGGARALVYSRRLTAMGSRLDYGAVVGDVYSQSTGQHSKEWEAWKCPECGSSRLGVAAAGECCVNME
jgi:hypothetical protein